MPSIILNDSNEIEIRFQRSDFLVLEVKKIPGRRWDPDRVAWIVPIKAGVLPPLVAFSTISKIDIGQSVTAALEEVEKFKEDNIKLSAAVDLSDIRPKEKDLLKPFEIMISAVGELREYQRVGIVYGLRNKKLINGDHMGAGKTLQSLAVMQITLSFPCLIITTVKSKYVFYNEIQKWLPVYEGVTCILGESDPSGAHYGIFIVNYEQLKKFQFLFTVDWKMVIVDESHKIKNAEAQRTKDVIEICNRSERVMLLSGTPVRNGRPIELATQLQAIDRLESLGGFWEYARRYCNAAKKRFGEKTVWDFNGHANIEELTTRLRANCFLRREREETMSELPPIVEQVIPVQMAEWARKEYNRARSDLLAYFKETGQEARIEPTRRAEALVKVGVLRQLAAKGKVINAANFVIDFVEQNPDDKIILWAIHKEVIEKISQELNKKGVGSLYIIGGTDAAESSRIEKVFQEEKEARVLVMSIGAGSESLTLTAAHHMIFIEFPWTPGEMDQAESRSYARTNDPHGLLSFRMVCIDSIDEFILFNVLDGKKKVNKKVLDYVEDDAEMVRKYLFQDMEIQEKLL